MQQSTIKARAHAACAVNDEVWVARQEGGIAVFDAVSEALVAEIDLHVDGNDHVVARALMVVFHEVWVATVEGHVLIISIKARQLSTNSPLRLCVEDQAPHHGPVAEMCFNGHVAAIATSAGRTWLVHPIRKSVMAELITSASCTSVAHFYSFVVVGDVDGGLTIFDVLTGEIVVAHTRSSSEVLRVLHERSTGTLWVARKNGNVDVYELQQRELVLVRRVEGVGRTTSMMELSGNVVVSTYERKILIIRATTATIEEQIHAAHGSFVSGLTKVRHQEVARVWSLGNDEVMHGWTLSGHGVAINPPPFVSPVEQAAITSAMHGSWAMERANFGVRVEEERKKSVDLQDNLRKLREESQELRLRLLKMEEMIQVKDAELATQTGRVRLLEEETRKLSADITNMTTTVMNSERERLLLQADANQARDDLTRCRTEVQQVQSAKAMVDQELSQRSTEKFHVEQRLMDCQNKLASITAENARLCAAVGNVASAQRAERDVQAKIIEGSAATNQELEQVRSMNRMLSSLLASMQYSLRRKEQEDRDLTALLSAFRRKVADHVTDPFLSALLLATMVRNPMRLELECDDVTRGQLMDRHGPFMQFLEALREQDREAYDKLIDYLQLSSSDNLSPETRQLVDSFVRLAVKDGKVSTESIASFKRSIPNLMDGSGAGATATIIPPPSGYPSPGVGLLPNNAMMAAASPTTTSLPYNVGLPPMSTAVGALNMVGLPPPLPPNPSATSPAAMPNGYELPLPPLPTSMVGLIGAATPGSTAASPNTNTTTINNNASYLHALLSPPPIHGLASPTAAPAATTPQSPLPLPLGVPTISPYPPPVAEEDGQTDSLMKVIRNQYAMDERYLREHRAMFEFIIKTRRTLAECLALLFKRTVSAKQVVEALTGGTSATAAGTPAHLSNIFRGIIEELAELVADVVTKYLTASEKQRLGVQ